MSSSRAGLSGLARQPRPRMSSPAWAAPAWDSVTGGVPVPGGRGVLRLAERVVQAGSRRSAGGEQVADGGDGQPAHLGQAADQPQLPQV